MALIIKNLLYNDKVCEVSQINNYLSNISKFKNPIVTFFNKIPHNLYIETPIVNFDLLLIIDNKIEKIVNHRAFTNLNIQICCDYIIIFPEKFSYFTKGESISYYECMTINAWENILKKWIQQDVNFVSSHLKKDDVYIDIGANTGLFTQMILDNINDSFLSKIILFEPVDRFYNECLKKFSIKENFIIENVGLSDSIGIKEIFLNRNNLGNNEIPQKNVSYEDFDKSTIYCDTLSHYLISNSIEKVDFLKIDTEGHDVNILYGFIPWLKQSNNYPKILFETNWRNLSLEESIITILKNEFSYRVIRNVNHNNTFLIPQ